MPDWIQVIWKSLFSISVLFLMAKLLGYRQISQLTYFQYITGITIGSLAAVASTDLEKLDLGITALVVWSLTAFGIEWLTLKSKTARDFFEGKGIVLIKDGKIMEDNLKKARYNSDDLLEQLRKKNAFKAADVEFAVLEPSGELSVLKRREKQPLTASHLGVKVPNEQEPQTVIMDGQIMDEPLATIGFSRGWLKTELDKKGVAIENVYLGQVDQYGQLYLDLFDDNIKLPSPQERESLLSELKKCAADLESFGLSTENPKSQKMYADCAVKMNAMIQEITPWLKR